MSYMPDFYFKKKYCDGSMKNVYQELKTESMKMSQEPFSVIWESDLHCSGNGTREKWAYSRES